MDPFFHPFLTSIQNEYVAGISGYEYLTGPRSNLMFDFIYTKTMTTKSKDGRKWLTKEAI